MKTGIHFTRCNVGSAEQLNARDKECMAAINVSTKKKYSIFEDMTAYNLSWRNPEYSGKSLQEIFENQKKTYTEKTGRKPPLKDRIRVNKKTGKEYTVSGWSPIREGVCSIKTDTAIDDFQPFLNWLQSKGVKIISLYIQHDTGHTDELTGNQKINHHAKIICDWLDYDTGKTIKLTDDDMTEMQTVIAEALGMKRGESKKLTGAEHLTPADFRAKKTAEKIKELEKLKTKLENDSRIISTSENVETVLKIARERIIDAISASFDTEKNIDVAGCYMQEGTIVVARYTRLVRKDGSVAVECVLKDITDDDLTEATENLAVLTFNELYDIWKAIKNN